MPGTYDRMGNGMDLTAVRAFATLARHGRFTRAAQALGVTQPSLSRQVQRLEKELGARLVVRAPDGVVLTEAGARFLAHAQRALTALDEAAGELAEIAGVAQGAVGIGTLATVGAYVLPAVLAAYHRKHPAVRLTVREGFRDELEALVLRGDLDMAVIQLPPRHEELTAVRLWQEDYVLAVPPEHRLADARRAVALVDVADEPFVLIPGGTASAALEAACSQRGLRPHIALVTDNVESVRRMVEAGLGLALVPRIMARERTRWRAGLVSLSAGGVHRQVALIHRGGSYLTAAARALRDAIVAHARKELA